MYQRLGPAAYRSGLDSIKLLDLYLGYPHKNFKSIHIAGTNGKGSTSHMIASVLQAAGYKTGLYTSPHLLDFKERVKVNGIEISPDEVVIFINSNKSYFEKEKFTFFEMSVALAFWYFSKVKVDYAIIEVGLGGRLDATNIITPVLSIITNIGLDHTQFLGKTHKKIAFEKAGIIKNRIPIIVGEKDIKTEDTFIEISRKLNAPLYFVKNTSANFTSDLKGFYQIKNIQTVITAFNHLPDINLDNSIIKKGLNRVVENTGLKGRWQVVQNSPKVILDIGHNREALTLISQQLSEISYGKLYLVMGFIKEREINSLLSLFPKEANFYLSSPNIERAMPLKILKSFLESSDLKINYFKSIPIAYKMAISNSGPDDLIFVTGSTFVVADILEYLEMKG
nr:tetrahydrofolate synthase [uncultured bacterium]